MEIIPAAMLEMIIGMKNTETLEGPFSIYLVCSWWMVLNPPMPLPMITPTRKGSRSSNLVPTSSMAILAAAMAS